MISALFGLGTADFMARFSARALGATLTYGAVLLIGAVGATIWLLATGAELIWSPLGWGIATLHGFSVSIMCILLYMGIARGPIAVVVPIVAAHPALVLAVNVAVGLRPSGLQWAAMAAIVAGSILIARGTASEVKDSRTTADRLTLLIALGACVAYAAIVLTGQAAAAIIGEFQTMWIGRWTGLALIAGLLLVQGVPIRIPSEWIPFVGLQGGLDAAGYFAFLAGANTAAPHVTMVVASAFGVVTVLLAWLLLREPVSQGQWTAIILIAAGTAILSGT